MLIPYNVDRPARHFPYVTYSLMAINVFLFFVTVFIANVNLPADRITARQDAADLLNTQGATDTDAKSAIEAAKGLDPDLAKQEKITFDDPKASGDDSDKGFSIFGKKGAKGLARLLLWQAALKLAYAHVDNAQDYNRAWRIEYMDSSYVVTPHYSALQWFAYRPGEQSVIVKIMGLIGSMFLHGGFEHILGNMLFLWVFGRAVEDSLGPRVYLGAYLLCGIAATLLYHITTMMFAPSAMQIPSFGASGAIMGVLGLFAPRFYRTPVRAYFTPVFLIASVIVTGVLYGLTHDIGISSFLAIFVTGGILYANRHKLPWATRTYPAAWFLAAWIGYNDLYPAIHALTWGKGTNTGDGTAHWAHIGGFFFGMLYAFLIGAQKEGKQEFMLEDAEKAFNLGDSAGAITYSQSVLEREPGNPGAYETLAKSYMKQNQENEALDNFELAIENYLRVGERGKAAACYLMALEKYPRFILLAPTQLAVGNQMAKNFSFKESAETLVKIPYTFPDAPEGEVALLRASQLYLQHLDQPQTTVQLLQFFLQKYPESQWMPQVERAWKMAHHQMMQPVEAEVAPEPEVEVPAEPVRIRPQAVAPVLELEPVDGAANQGYSTQSAPPANRAGGAPTQAMPGAAPRPSGTPTQQMPQSGTSAAPRPPGR